MGAGKSALLKMLRYYSRYVSRKPISLVSLNEPGLEKPFDIVERISRAVFIPSLLRRKSASRLLLVIAGQALPNFEALLGDGRPQLVRIMGLSASGEEDMKAVLKAHGYENLSDEEVSFISAKVGQVPSVARALELASVLTLN